MSDAACPPIGLTRRRSWEVPVDPPWQAVRLIGLGAVLEAPAFVAGFYDVAVVGQPIEQSRCHFGVAEDAGPFAEG